MLGIIEGMIESVVIVRKIGRISDWWFGSSPFKDRTYVPTSEALDVVILIRILDYDERVTVSILIKEGTVIPAPFFVTPENE